MESVRSAFHAQLATVMDSLLAAAVSEIAKIFESSLCEQQLELAQKTEQISMLRCRLEKVEKRHKANSGGIEDGELFSGDGEGSQRQQAPTGSVSLVLNVGKDPSLSEPEVVLSLLKEEVTGQEVSSAKHKDVRPQSVTVQATDGNVCVSHTSRGSPKTESALLQAGEWLPGLNGTRVGVSGLENLQADKDRSAAASGGICNAPSCFQRGFGSDETSNEVDNAPFAFLDRESENQNSEQSPGDNEAQTDLAPATSVEAAWQMRGERYARDHIRDPLRPQSNSRLLAAQQINTRSHSAAPSRRPYSCPYCIKCFTYPSHQRRHLLRHSGVRLHPCQFCDKSFLTPSELTVHIRTHTGERPFACSQCGKRFARSGNLRAHQRDVHMGKRPFACAECGKRFSHKGNLRVHNHRVHQGDSCYTDGQQEPDMGQNAASKQQK